MTSIMTRRQRGATLLVTLIMLVVLTLFALTGFNLSSVNLKIIGNFQQQKSTEAVVQQALEYLISTPTAFNLTPTAACICVNGTSADCGTCGAQGSSGGGGGCGVFSVVCNAASDAFDAVTDQPLAWAANAVGVADLVPLEEFGPWGMVAEAVIDIAAAGVWQVQIELSDCDAATKNYLTGLNLDNGVIGTINAANPVPNPAAMAAEGGFYVTTSAVLSKC